MTWQEAVAEMTVCQRCHLAKTRKNVVVYRGSAKPRILFVGEAPGRREDESGLPFMGSAGKILDRAIAELAISESEIGITNVFMCRPPGNVFDPVAAAACRPWLELKVRLLDPRVIVTLGANPLRSFNAGAGPITSEAGHAFDWHRRKIFPMLHPASTLRRRAYAQRWKEDISGLKALLGSLREPQMP
jgi:DNA polymerase